MSLENFIEVIEKSIGKKAKKIFMDMQLGDTYYTSANIEKIQSCVDFNPESSIEKGMPIFINWYKNFYKI